MASGSGWPFNSGRCKRGPKFTFAVFSKGFRGFLRCAAPSSCPECLSLWFQRQPSLSCGPVCPPTLCPIAVLAAFLQFNLRGTGTEVSVVG